jgi:hypothetical protein
VRVGSCLSLRLDSRGARVIAARAQEDTEDARVCSCEARVLPETASPQCAFCSLQWGECTVSIRCLVPNFRAVHCLRHFCTQDTVTHLLLVGFEVLTPVVMKSHLLGYNAVWSVVSQNRRFGRTYHLHLQVTLVSC